MALALRAAFAAQNGSPAVWSPAGREKGKSEAKRHPQVCGNSLRLGCAGCAVTGAPMQRQRDAGKARRVGARDRAQFDVSPGTDCRRTPGVALRSRRAGCPETAVSGWPFSWLLLFGHAKRSNSLAGRRVKSRHGCRAAKRRKTQLQARNWVTCCVCSLPFGPFAKRMFAPASHLLSLSSAGTTGWQARRFRGAGPFGKIQSGGSACVRRVCDAKGNEQNRYAPRAGSPG